MKFLRVKFQRISGARSFAGQRKKWLSRNSKKKKAQGRAYMHFKDTYHQLNKIYGALSKVQRGYKKQQRGEKGRKMQGP